MDKNIDTLYHFQLNEETGEVIRREITTYEAGVWTSQKMYWRYRYHGTMYYCYQSDLDRFKNGHVYSFDDSIPHARSIILTEIKKRRAKAKREYDRWDDVFKKLKESY